MSDLKVSICIICMNRLEHLKKTLKQNIYDNSSYSNAEFILLDYNSKDDMESWAKENLSSYIENGRLSYYKTFQPTVFNHSHSKNMAFKLAQGDIVCNVNSDHYTGKDFLAYVNKVFNEDRNIFITAHYPLNEEKPANFCADNGGRVCLLKKDFLAATGFDETMNNYGFEDIDFVNRLEFANLKRHILDDPKYLKFVPHDDDSRYTKSDEITALFVTYISPWKSKLHLLEKSNKLKTFHIIDNVQRSASDYKKALQSGKKYFDFSIEKRSVKEGQWKEMSQGNLLFQLSGKNYMIHKIQEGIYSPSHGDRLYAVKEKLVLEDVEKFYIQYSNRVTMEKNALLKRTAVNDSYGAGIVYKNFNYLTPIFL